MQEVVSDDDDDDVVVVVVVVVYELLVEWGLHAVLTC
jgi:hypothetical protein